MKKFISLLLTLAMVLSLAVPALAAEPAVTGKQSGEVSGTYNPTVAITGVSLIVDDTTYTEGNVTITPDSTVTLTVTGTNLQYGTSDHRVQFASGMNVPIISDYFTFSDDGTTATWDATASNFSNSSNHEIVYYNDYTSDNRTPISTGIYVTYNEGTAPDTKTIYFDNTEGWSTVYAYAWSSDPNTDYLGAWPGSAMTKVEGTERIYAIEVPTDAVNVIFNNGSGGTGSQTSDQTIPTDDKNLYTYSTNEWSVYGGTTEPTVEAKWGTSVDNLTGSGTLAEAIAAAADDSSITYIQLQSDVTTDVSHLIRSGVFTLDLNGKTLSSAAYTLDVRNSGTVVTLTDTAAGGKVTAGDGGVAVSATSSGKVVINGGSYSGTRALSVSYGGIAEIKAGTFTPYSLIYRTIYVDDTSSLTITGGTFTAGVSSLYTKGTTTITGGTFTSGSEGHITYMAGTLDLSGYDTEKLNGLTLSQLTGADLTVSDENIQLPAGYVFQDGETTVTTLAHETVYTIAAEATVPTYTIKTSGEGGTVTADKAAAAEGETVTVTVTPNENYVLFALSAYEPNNGDNTVELTPGTAANTYTFLMPAHDVSIFGDFTKDGKAREDLYFNNNGNAAWTNVAAVFYTNSDHYIDRVNLVLAENGIYTLPKDVEIPNLAYRVYFSIGTAMTAKAEIPTGENNMFTLGTATNESGHYEGTWSKYTPSQPPEEVASAEITWGSMAFTYTDGENGAEGAWSVDSTAEDAGTVTVRNTGTASITASAAYTSATDYEEIDGTLGDAKTLAAGEKGTFTLILSGKPGKSILANTKIGTVIVTIQ